MALFKILRGESINLADTPVTDGFAYFTPEDGKFYIDYGTSGDEPIFGRSSTPNLEQLVPNRICINDNNNICRFVVGTSTSGWTSADCDYLCDGTADQVEINAAITALPATGGEIVILDGTYNITAEINVTKDNVSIRGNGNATILKRMFNSASSEGVITLTGRSDCKISNLQVDGNKGSYDSYRNSGIYLSNSSNNTVTGNTCSNNNTTGIYLFSSSSNNTVTSNTCNNNTTGIALFPSSSNNTVTSNTCSNNNYGIYLDSSSNNTVTSNTCNNNGSGIYLYSSSNNNTVTGNTSNNNNYGIGLFSSSNNTVTGNTCICGTGLAADYTTGQHTIRLYGTGNNYNLIAMNNCMGKTPRVDGGTGNSVYGNKYDSGDYKDFTQDEKTKLAGIATGANKYTHPATHPASMITGLPIGFLPQIVVTVASGSTVTATCGDKTVAGTSSGTCVLNIPNYGTWTVTATLGEDTTTGTVVIDTVKQYSITLDYIYHTLNNNSWADIHSVSANGANYWSVGDRKAVNLSGTVGTLSVSGTYYVYILGFNHNSGIEGNGIHFGGFKTALTGGTDICLVDSKYNKSSTDESKRFNMNHGSNTNGGGWKGCDLRYDVLGSVNSRGTQNAAATTATNPVSNTLIAALPSDLRSVMRPMTKYSDNTGGGNDTARYVTATVDYLPLLSEFEIFGKRSLANSAEKKYQVQYAYFANGNSKVKYKHNQTATSAWWWGRSVCSGYTSGFCSVNTYGRPDYDGDDAKYSGGISPAFKV